MRCVISVEIDVNSGASQSPGELSGSCWLAHESSSCPSYLRPVKVVVVVYPAISTTPSTNEFELLFYILVNHRYWVTRLLKESQYAGRHCARVIKILGTESMSREATETSVLLRVFGFYVEDLEGWIYNLYLLGGTFS